MLIPNLATVFARERSKNGLYQKYFFVNRPGAQWAPYGPHGPHMGPMGPIWAPWAPYGPNGPHMGPGGPYKKYFNHYDILTGSAGYYLLFI